jgi:hypothetical protein
MNMSETAPKDIIALVQGMESSSSGMLLNDVPILVVKSNTSPKPKRQRFVATFPEDITQAEFQARLNALKDPSLPVKALWRQFTLKGGVSIRIKKA